MPRERTTLSLHITHPTRELVSVCKTLGYRPKVIWSKGEQRRTPSGTALKGIRDYSYCSIDLGPTSRARLSAKIETSLRSLRPHRALLRRLTSSGGRISFYVGWFCQGDSGDEFDWTLLAALADSRIALDFLIYGPDD